jgi:gamma-glutamyltranspeptidase
VLVLNIWVVTVSWTDINFGVNLSVHRSGFRVAESLFAAKNLLHKSEFNEFNDRLRQWMAELEAGKNITLPELAVTLELIAVGGPDGQ